MSMIQISLVELRKSLEFQNSFRQGIVVELRKVLKNFFKASLKIYTLIDNHKN